MKICKNLKSNLALFGAIILLAIVLLSFSGCGNSMAKESEGVIDLTTMSSNMVYSQVYNMVNESDKFTGKVVRAKGVHNIYYDSNTNTTYHSVIIQDALGCCAQGLEFILSSDNYPSPNEQITVQGTFGTYDEFGIKYCCLYSSKLM